MKQFLLSTAVLVVLGAPAGAADLVAPVDAPYPIADVPTYDWTGIYLGAHGGGVWGEKDLAWVAFIPGPIDPPSRLDQDVEGFLGGFQGGVNWQIASWVVGAEVDFSWSSADAEDECPFPNGTAECSTDVEWIGTAAPRIGYAWNNLLIFGKAGLAWAHDEYEVTYELIPAGNEEGSQDRHGWMVGAGLEWGFARNWSFKAEYNYLEMGEEDVDLEFANSGDYDETVEVDQSLHLAKVGLNYRFNWLD